MLLHESLFYERCNPIQGVCSLCGDPSGPFTLEDRFTGKGFALQRWPFCEKCRTAARASSPDADLLACKYLIFLRWIMSAYRLERRPGAQHVYRITPKKQIDMPIRIGISSFHAKKNNTEHRSGFDRPNEIPSNPGTPGREHYNGGTLREILGEGRALRNEAKDETEKLTAEADMPTAANCRHALTLHME
jgi:hypothetical protein